jgi:hypothetical protein
MLLAIEKLLQERGRMSLAELSIHFDTDAAALEPMLETLIRKGRVEKLDPDASICGKRCSGCSQACGAEAVVYRWTA